MAQGYTTIRQHEPLRVPSKWSDEERRLVGQIEELMDGLFASFNRLKLTDFAEIARNEVVTRSGVAATGDVTVNGARVDAATFYATHLAPEDEEHEFLGADGDFAGNLTAAATLFKLLRAKTGGGLEIGKLRLYETILQILDDTYNALKIEYAANEGVELSSDGEIRFLSPVTIDGFPLLKIQRGTANAKTSATTTVTFPIAFTEAPTVVATYAPTELSVTDWGTLRVFGVSSSVFNLRCGGSAPTTDTPVNWIAVGV